MFGPQGSRHPGARGHTLIEFIGVLAVLAILALALTPVVIRRMDSAAWTKEVNDMTAISNALVLQILRSNSIPNETSWAASAANWAMRPVSQISTNNRRYARLFLYDSGGWMTNASSGSGYTQTNTGTIVPSNARLLLVSTIATALPSTNGPLSTANFNTIWDATLYSKPTFFSTWNGKGDDLVIQRLRLDPTFHRLILANRDASGAAAFSINSTNPVNRLSVPNSGTGWSSYYLDGTVVGLWSNTVPTYRFVLTSDISFTFESGTWRAQLTGGGKDNSATAQSFANQATTFLATANYAGSHQGADTQGALSSFYTFMYAYTLWANKCPHFQYTGSQLQAIEFQILDAMGSGGNAGIINNATGSGGLLK